MKTDTGKGSVLRIACGLRSKPISESSAPQNMYTPILLDMKAIKDTGLLLQGVPEKLASTY